MAGNGGLGKDFENITMKKRGNHDSDQRMDQTRINKAVKAGVAFLSRLPHRQREKILSLLKDVSEIQQSELSKREKIKAIKKILWNDRSIKTKLLIGGFLGAITGFMIFGTGGIGIAALGSATGIWGWLVSAIAGTIIVSIRENFARKD